MFGWAHSLNKSVKEAPWFYVVYLAMLLGAGAIVLIPGAPLITITMFVQVVAVTLLPSALVFLILILNDPAFMGEHVNTRWQNIANWSIVLFVIVDVHPVRDQHAVPRLVRGGQVGGRHGSADRSAAESPGPAAGDRELPLPLLLRAAQAAGVRREDQGPDREGSRTSSSP